MKQFCMDYLLVLWVIVPYAIAACLLFLGPGLISESREKAVRLERRIGARRARRKKAA
ncbi:MAG: hypothetical protein NUV48_07235 [Peptococcaceae bacterium]|jgi:hypothetical protein|nr:hypothetical protein [Peptococcaceae bacterium]